MIQPNYATQIKMYVKTFTPAEAREWLGDNDQNRDLRNHAIKAYADLMKDGKWALNGETIIRSNLGRLLDGQHRLLACIAADAPFESCVVEGIDDPKFLSIDSGCRRSAVDWLKIDHGMTGTNTLCSAATTVIKLRRGELHHNQSIQMDELLKFIVEDRDLLESVTITKGCSPLLLPRISAALHYEFATRNKKAADEFFALLSTGEGLLSVSPIYVLREHLIKHRSGNRQLKAEYMAAITIKAWNAYRLGKPLKKIMFGFKEEFPVIA